MPREKKERSSKKSLVEQLKEHMGWMIMPVVCCLDCNHSRGMAGLECWLNPALHIQTSAHYTCKHAKRKEAMK